MYVLRNYIHYQIMEDVTLLAVAGSGIRTRVLITGVAGLLGSHLSRYLSDRNYSVIGLDSLSGGYKDFIDERIIFEHVDLSDQERLQVLFEYYRPDYVFHLAAYAAQCLSPFIRNYNYTNNILCSANVINCCVRYNVKKIIFTSSMAVYGENITPFNESQLPTPVDPYGIAKYAVEMDLKQAYEQFGLKYSIVRPHNIVGIYQNIWDRYRNVIGIWCRQILNGEPLSIYGDGMQERAFSDVRYCLEPLEKLMMMGDGEIYNIGADKSYTINEIAKILVDHGTRKGYAPIIKHYEARHEVKHAFSDHSKAKAQLGFHDETDMEELVATIFDWAEGQPEREIKNMKYEIDRGIYSYWKSPN